MVHHHYYALHDEGHLELLRPIGKRRYRKGSGDDWNAGEKFLHNSTTILIFGFSTETGSHKNVGVVNYNTQINRMEAEIVAFNSSLLVHRSAVVNILIGNTRYKAVCNRPFWQTYGFLITNPYGLASVKVLYIDLQSNQKPSY